MVILEAMALGLPVIASNVGGVPEVVEHAVNGYLLPVGDVAHHRHQLREVIKKPQVLPMLGSRARDRVAAGYSVDTVSRQMLDLYNCLVDN